MQTWDLIQANLLSPPVLAFLLGAVAVLIRSDLAVPEALYSTLSIYLLLAIGLRGGHELAMTPLSQLWRPVLGTLALGVTIPLLCFLVLKLTRRFGTADAAALAAHYGSVSIVTFAATLNFLDIRGVKYEGFVSTLVALLEIPAIIIALLLAKVLMARESGSSGNMSWKKVLHETFTSRSVLLLVGGLVAGYLSTDENMKKVSPLFVNLFNGMLVLFLLELGMVATQRLRHALKPAGEDAAGTAVASRGTMVVLFACAILFPIVNGTLGVLVAAWTQLSFGGAVTLGVMAASASYIAAPAAVRVALPQANPGYYLTAALGVTFPFNLTIGIPLIYEISRRVYG